MDDLSKDKKTIVGISASATVAFTLLFVFFVLLGTVCWGD